MCTPVARSHWGARAFPGARTRTLGIAHSSRSRTHAPCSWSAILRYPVQRHRRHRRAVLEQTRQAYQRFAIRLGTQAPHSARRSQEISVPSRWIARFPLRAGRDGRAVNDTVDAPPGERALDLGRVANVHPHDIDQRAMRRQRRCNRRSQLPGVQQGHLESYARAAPRRRSCRHSPRRRSP